MNRNVISVFMIGLVSTFVACTGIVSDTRGYPDPVCPPQKYKKIIVYVNLSDAALRSRCETEAYKYFADYDVQIVPSISILPPNSSMDNEEIWSRISNVGADGILFVNVKNSGATLVKIPKTTVEQSRTKAHVEYDSQEDRLKGKSKTTTIQNEYGGYTDIDKYTVEMHYEFYDNAKKCVVWNAYANNSTKSMNKWNDMNDLIEKSMGPAVEEMVKSRMLVRR